MPANAGVSFVSQAASLTPAATHLAASSFSNTTRLSTSHGLSLRHRSMIGLSVTASNGATALDLWISSYT